MVINYYTFGYNIISIMIIEPVKKSINYLTLSMHIKI